jgi:hypothetical protein
VFVEGHSKRDAARVFGLARETVDKICRFSGFCCKVRFPSQFATKKLHEPNALCVAYPVQKQTLQRNPLDRGVTFG